MKSRFAIFAIRDRRFGVDLQISETDIPIGVPIVWKRLKRKNGIRMGVKYLRDKTKGCEHCNSANLKLVAELKERIKNLARKK